MTRHAILCGSAPDGFTQKKINEMYDFLASEAGGFWAEKEITIFPNGIAEEMLSFVLERLKADKTKQILLYICALSPVGDGEKSVWLGGEEVRKSVIESVASKGSVTATSMAKETSRSVEVEPAETETGCCSGFQVIYDICRDFIADEETDDEMEDVTVFTEKIS